MLESDSDIIKFLEKDGIKLLLISSPVCPHCIKAHELLSASPNTLKICFEAVGICYFNDAKKFCKDRSISVTPTFLIYDGEEELSRINYAPKDQKEFFEWITNSLI